MKIKDEKHYQIYKKYLVEGCPVDVLSFAKELGVDVFPMHNKSSCIKSFGLFT